MGVPKYIKIRENIEDIDHPSLQEVHVSLKGRILEVRKRVINESIYRAYHPDSGDHIDFFEEEVIEINTELEKKVMEIDDEDRT